MDGLGNPHPWKLDELERERKEAAQRIIDDAARLRLQQVRRLAGLCIECGQGKELSTSVNEFRGNF